MHFSAEASYNHEFFKEFTSKLLNLKAGPIIGEILKAGRGKNYTEKEEKITLRRLTTIAWDNSYLDQLIKLKIEEPGSLDSTQQSSLYRSG